MTWRTFTQCGRHALKILALFVILTQSVLYLAFNHESKVISDDYKYALCDEDKTSIDRVMKFNHLEVIKAEDFFKAVMSPVQSGCDQIKRIGN